MNRVFVDLDGVVVDFDGYKNSLGLTQDEVKKRPGAYLYMPPIFGALEAVRSVIGMGFNVFIATKPPTGIPYAYSDKAEWVLKYLPELKRKIIITSDKGLLGDEGDILIDDRPHKANCAEFRGLFIPFVSWDQTLEILRERKSHLKENKMTVRAKYRCTEVTKTMAWNDKTRFLYRAKFNVVTDGSDENKRFFEYTPSGSIEIGTYKEDHFKVGGEYYVDFSEAVQ